MNEDCLLGFLTNKIGILLKKEPCAHKLRQKFYNKKTKITLEIVFHKNIVRRDKAKIVSKKFN